MAVMQVTSAQFKELIQSPEMVLVDFQASWCDSCKALSPVLDKVAEETGITIAKVDVDESRDLVKEYGLKSIPTLIVFENGEAKNQSVGFVGKGKVLELLGK